MSMEIFPVRRLAFRELEALPLPWSLEVTPPGKGCAGILLLPDVARAVVWRAGDAVEERIVRPYYASGAIWFEVFGSNVRRDWCGPFFTRLGEALGTSFVTELGNRVTEDEGVDSTGEENWRDDLRDAARCAIEREPGSVDKYFHEPPKRKP